MMMNMHDLPVNIPILPSLSAAGLPPPDRDGWKTRPVGALDGSGLDSQPTRLSSRTCQGNVWLRGVPRP